MWCEPCANIYEYAYAGAMGRYPKYKYRFSRIGDGSIAKDKFQDIILSNTDCIVGKKTSLGSVIELKTTGDNK